MAPIGTIRSTRGCCEIFCAMSVCVEGLTDLSRVRFDENYGLASTQSLKNKDIPEGGAKGPILPSSVPVSLIPNPGGWANGVRFGSQVGRESETVLREIRRREWPVSINGGFCWGFGLMCIHRARSLSWISSSLGRAPVSRSASSIYTTSLRYCSSDPMVSFLRGSLVIWDRC